MEQVRHSDQDLYEFKVLIEKKKEIAQRELAYLANRLNDGQFGDDFPEDKLKMIIERQHEFIASLDQKLVKIQEKTFGVTAKGQLVLKAKVIEVITASKAHDEEIPTHQQPVFIPKNRDADKPAVRTCRNCGCTENDCRQCIAKTGSPCSWVEADLCSACVEEPGQTGYKKDGAIHRAMQRQEGTQQKATASPEAIQLPDNVRDMEFFKQLHTVAPGVDLTIQLKEKNGKFTMSVLPNVASKSPIQPLLVTGTPEEIDDKFFELVSQPLNETAATLLNAEEHKKSVAEAVKSEDKPAAKSATKPAPSKTAAKKSAAKKAAKKPAAKPTPDIEAGEEDNDEEDQPSTEDPSKEEPAKPKELFDQPQQ